MHTLGSPNLWRLQIECLNACNSLSTVSFNGKNLKVVLKKEKLQPETIVVECIEEEYKELADVSSHGARFHMTGGGTSCDDKAFKAFASRRCRIKREILKKGKAASSAAAEDNKKDTLKELAAEAAAQNAAKLKNHRLSVKNLSLDIVSVLWDVEKKEIVSIYCFLMFVQLKTNDQLLMTLQGKASRYDSSF